MNTKEVLEVFRAETPVRFGNLVFNRIESVNYRGHAMLHRWHT